MATSAVLITAASVLVWAAPGPTIGGDLFAYDRSSALQVKELGVEIDSGIHTRHIAFSGPALDREVDAYLVLPAGEGPFPAIVYLHMYPGSNKQFLDEARTLARSGVLSLLVEGLFPWHRLPEDLEADRSAIGRQVVELRRAVDLLSLRKEVDPKRIAFVGMDYGAMHGVALASVDERVRALVLAVPAPTYEQWNSIVYHEPLGPAYQQGMRQLDPVERIGRASAPVLLQFCTDDRFVSREDADRIIQAAKQPRVVKWYTGGHGAADSAGRKDRIEWLLDQLGVKEGAGR